MQACKLIMFYYACTHVRSRVWSGSAAKGVLRKRAQIGAPVREGNPWKCLEVQGSAGKCAAVHRSHCNKLRCSLYQACDSGVKHASHKFAKGDSLEFWSFRVQSFMCSRRGSIVGFAVGHSKFLQHAQNISFLRKGIWCNLCDRERFSF